LRHTYESKCRERWWTDGDEHCWSGHIDWKARSEQAAEVDTVHHESDEESKALIGKSSDENEHCLVSWLGLGDGRCECSHQHCRENRKYPSRQDVGDDELLDGEEDIIVEDGEESCADGVCPECISESH